MNTMFVLEGILSDGEREKLRELRQLAEARIETHKNSLDQTNNRLKEARKRNSIAQIVYEEALIALQPDEDDDDAGAVLDKREKFEAVEAEYIEAGRAYNAALTRAGWELREAQRFGLTK